MLRLVLAHTKDHPETPVGEDGPTAWLCDEQGNAVYEGHVFVDGDFLVASSTPGSVVSSGLRFVGRRNK